ncbi:ABC transporter substrate-binding protein [Rhodobacter maris]|uniref:NitT/TauT family transport system substrate-binding protein n=1 Tax=Rhodobacter maris TaxID=446682 RepID=A0A285RM37_9RHOB|nr:ABC transporter substrate-binding protein [Rhodobacter maris]SOB93522.1 NitT/TauT family transport system substrate-binding protein [Rhodobacter maris]
MTLLTRLAGLALGALLSTAPAPADTLTFAWSPAPQAPQVALAQARGYFTAAGLTVHIVPFASGREAFEALLGGQADLAFMTEFPAATGILTGQRFAIVADLARYSGSRIIGNAAAGPLARVADLEGRRIGTTIGTNVHYFLDHALAAAGVRATIISAAPGDLVAALARGDVDAIAPFPSFYSAARATLGPDYRELRPGGYEVHYILVATPDLSEAGSARLSAFLGALIRAETDLKEDPAAAQEVVSRSMAGAIPAREIAALWRDVDIGLALPPDLADLIRTEAGWILDQGVIRGPLPSVETVAAHIRPAALEAATR